MPKQKLARDGRDSLIVLVKTLQQALRNELESSLRGVGLTLAQQGVMVTLMRMPGASSAELARAAFISPQSMGEVLGSLERAGLVSRAPDAENARILRATVTKLGLKAVARGGERAAAVEGKLVSAMSAGEQRVLRDLLGRCVSALRGPPT